MNIWEILGIKPTTDIVALKMAYARRAAEFHPEEDPAGFLALHDAYTRAMEYAAGYGKGDCGTIVDTPAPAHPAFRPAPKNLHRLGQVASPGHQEAAQDDSPVQIGQPGGDSRPRSGANRALPGAARLQEDAGQPENTFCFPKPADAAAKSEQTGNHEGQYCFPKGGATGTPPLPEQETGGENSPPGYVFLRQADTAGLPPQGPVAPKPRDGAASSDGPLIFPGFLPLDCGADMNMPFMPLIVGSDAQEYRPLTREEEERLQLLESARNQCLEDLESLLEREAPAQDWYPVLLGADFSLVRYNVKFLLNLLRLCQKQDMSREMASALYMAYGFASIKALKKYPVATPVFEVLNQYAILPQDNIPLLSLSENLHKSDIVIAGIARLSAVCSEPYVCGQSVRSPAFAHVKHQPYFILRLAEFLKNTDVPGEWRQALAWAYQFRETPASPYLRALSEQLPPAVEGQVYGDYAREADSLLLGEEALPVFLVMARESILEMLEKTRKGFPQSRRKEPWAYVFTHPAFTVVRRDSDFLYQLLLFLWEKTLPTGIWLALAEAFAAEFAELPENKGTMPEPGPDLAPEERVAVCLMLLRETLENHGRSFY
ncbi:hypothetical protein LJC36_01310 [Desulfovibrio sp. OttesenSCG-928-C14]|nr:hypothetical protein [Desulfovibrio sp. OttesenSCG-928-C14]